MKILVIGGGGREHALVWKIKQSPKVEKIYCIPGNGGIAEIADCIPLPLDDLESLAQFAFEKEIDLTVVGPEIPLSRGIVDVFMEKGLRIFGPTKAAAEIEGSKVFAKEIMNRYHIPTAASGSFEDEQDAVNFIEAMDTPIVVKADGLAAGKGVIIAQTKEEAKDAVHVMMAEKAFGDAGTCVLIEEFLEGEEVSILAFSDGKTVVPMVPSQDHKRIFEGDEGPNTGGMGAYSPVSIFMPDLQDEVMRQVLQPTVDGMAKEGMPYKGVLYAGLMLTATGIKVLEFNARFGDPETQVVLPRLQTDLIDIMEAVIDQRLDQMTIEWTSNHAAVVVVSSGGYPGKYVKGKVITFNQPQDEEVIVFHAGTKKDGQDIVTYGGRVLGVTGIGETLQDALHKAYKAIEHIKFEDMFYRRDIGHRELARKKD